jgi:hypothetical protein
MEFIREEFPEFPLSISLCRPARACPEHDSFSDVGCLREAQIAPLAGKPWAKTSSGTMQSQAGWRMHGA